jgi:hypothetical protein
VQDSPAVTIWSGIEPKAMTAAASLWQTVPAPQIAEGQPRQGRHCIICRDELGSSTQAASRSHSLQAQDKCVQS